MCPGTYMLTSSASSPEQLRGVCISGLKRILTNLDRARKMRDSVLLNSTDSFLVTLPSTSTGTCVLFSSLVLGTDVFHDWLFLGCSSCVFLETAANFRFFFNVAIFSRKVLIRMIYPKSWKNHLGK